MSITIGAFIGGGIAACGAVTATHPFETVKIRVNYSKKGPSLSTIAVRYMAPASSCGVKVSVPYTVVLGFYDPMRASLAGFFFKDDKKQSLAINMFCGASLDTIMSRLYNQNGNLYKGVLDYALKTIRTEGVLAIYKGFLPHLARILPHTILTLSLAEQTNKLMRKVETLIIPDVVEANKAKAEAKANAKA
ncbi:mitochondrial oxaloacetate transport protein [Emericellopsis cladophorae]|uniref:Mitochondrial oxaloacetate transport protein n=1 Tax=Emericellopsis cladophorae TaxID=2686198 RepID=A0A9Q0BAN8_9HYPO|nr:mitochondrial oxaloacetate transport protein [Emericellopsis cladophorae]KAI6777725.1 mitochondrial oxaloacetate transport protein [Emericellopsis cladophorae]